MPRRNSLKGIESYVKVGDYVNNKCIRNSLKGIERGHGFGSTAFGYLSQKKLPKGNRKSIYMLPAVADLA